MKTYEFVSFKIKIKPCLLLFFLTTNQINN